MSNIKWSYTFHKCPYCEETSIIREPWMTNHVRKEHPERFDEFKKGTESD